MSTTKTVTVWETSRQKKTAFESEATTLGELESELDEKGINYADCDIFEGVSHTQLIDSNSVLPHDIPHKGQITNNLMIVLTLKNKKIASGAMDRKALGAFIKENNLGDEVKELFGRNWTQVKTDDLASFVERHKGKVLEKAPEKKQVKEVEDVEDAEGMGGNRDSLSEPVKSILKSILSGLKTLVEAHNRLVSDLYESDYIEDSDNFKVNIELPEGDGIVPEEKEEPEEKVPEGTFSDSEMKEMLNSL